MNKPAIACVAATAVANADTLRSANPQALASILRTSETRPIVACNGNFDGSGAKPWASNQPLSAALQRKLPRRPLRWQWRRLTRCASRCSGDEARDDQAAIYVASASRSLPTISSMCFFSATSGGARISESPVLLRFKPVS